MPSGRNTAVINGPKIIVSAIEHESVLDTAHDLEREGVEVVILPVDKKGIVDLKKLENELDERTILVSVMYVNNEIGSVQPIEKISEIIRNFRNNKVQISNAKSISKTQMSKTDSSSSRSFGIGHLDFGIAGVAYPLLHTDAAQALMYLDCNVQKLGIDLMTLSGQKVCGPKGIGALYVRDNSKVQNTKYLIPMVTGGGQEFGLRSGTENAPLIAGFGEVVKIAAALRAKNAKQVEGIKNYFWKKLKA